MHHRSSCRLKFKKNIKIQTMKERFGRARATQTKIIRQSKVDLEINAVVMRRGKAGHKTTKIYRIEIFQ